MTARRLDIDFGSMVFRVGVAEDGLAADAGTPDPRAVALFEQGMGQGSQQGRHEIDSEPMPLDAGLPPAMSPAAVMAAQGRRVAQTEGVADAQVLAREVLGLWVMHGADGRALRLQLQWPGMPAALAGTTLQLGEGEGRLMVTLEAGTPDGRDWLAPRLHALAAQLGQELGRPLRVLLPVPGGAGEADAEAVDWPEGAGP